MADETIEQAKTALRIKARATRAALSPALRATAAESVASHFFEHIAFAPTAVIAVYWPIVDEMDCQPILVMLMNTRQPVALPVVIGPDQPLAWRIWEPDTALVAAGFGTLAPSEQAPVAEPDIVLLPLLAFDRLGMRLGYGGGYYDRTLGLLAKRPKLIGLAFSSQEVDVIPRDAHDIPLDAVVTEAGVRFFGADA